MAYQIKLLFRLWTEPEDQVSSVDLYAYINLPFFSPLSRLFLLVTSQSNRTNKRLRPRHVTQAALHHLVLCDLVGADLVEPLGIPSLAFI
jgi:hypothetical protein